MGITTHVPVAVNCMNFELRCAESKSMSLGKHRGTWMYKNEKFYNLLKDYEETNNSSNHYYDYDDDAYIDIIAYFTHSRFRTNSHRPSQRRKRYGFECLCLFDGCILDTDLIDSPLALGSNLMIHRNNWLNNSNRKFVFVYGSHDLLIHEIILYKEK